METSSGIEEAFNGILNMESDLSIITPDALRLSTIDSIAVIDGPNVVGAGITEIVDSVGGGGVLISTIFGVISTTVTKDVGDDSGVDICVDVVVVVIVGVVVVIAGVVVNVVVAASVVVVVSLMLSQVLA